MSVMEIWLRLLEVSSLKGEIMRAAALSLQNIPNQKQALRSAGLNARQIQQFFAVKTDRLEQSLRWVEQPRHHLITVDDVRYPALLREIDWYPGALLVVGDADLLQRTQLAVVGSRVHSWYGEQWGRQFCEQLAVAGLTITSGLALGIDSVAHRAALAVNGHTLAVLGSGLEQIYPKRNQLLAEKIVQQGGALVSEFPLLTTPWPGNFPRRNRIISGLSLGVLVVEASMRSGSLVTARCALEQGREVFALPGPIGNPGCEGPNWLIKQGAIPVTGVQDIISQLAWDVPLVSAQTAISVKRENSSDTLSFASLLASVGDEVTAVDVIAWRSQLPLAQVASQLLELELAGQVAAVPGGYVRLRKLTS